MFIANNISTLQTLGAGDTLLDMCSNLPHLSRYMRKYQAHLNRKVFSLPSNHGEAHLIRHSLHSVVNDINIVHSVVSLPVLEPLTPAKLEKLSLLTMSCLYCSIANATASSIVGVSNAVSPKCSTNASGNASGSQGTKNSEEDYDSMAITVVEKSLEIFGLVSNIIKHSTRAGGHVSFNVLFILQDSNLLLRRSSRVKAVFFVFFFEIFFANYKNTTLNSLPYIYYHFESISTKFQTENIALLESITCAGNSKRSCE